MIYIPVTGVYNVPLKRCFIVCEKYSNVVRLYFRFAW